jgi:hypothetical protein
MTAIVINLMALIYRDFYVTVLIYRPFMSKYCVTCCALIYPFFSWCSLTERSRHKGLATQKAA